MPSSSLSVANNTHTHAERARTQVFLLPTRRAAILCETHASGPCVWMLSQLAGNFWVSLFIVASGAVCFPLHGCSLVIGPLIKVQLKIFARADETLITIKFMRIFIHPPSRALCAHASARRCCMRQLYYKDSIGKNTLAQMSRMNFVL